MKKPDLTLPPIAVLAGGLATRLRPITQTIPKALVPVAGRPFILHLLANMAAQGVRHCVLCVGHLGEQVEEVVGNGHSLGLEVSYSYDGGTLLGTGGAIAKALPKLGRFFFVTYGDTLLQINYADIWKTFQQDEGAQGLMTVLKNENRWDKSNTIFSDGGILEYNKNKISSEMKYIDYGLSLFSREAFDKFNTLEKFDLSDVFRNLLENKALAGYEVFQRFFEIGTPESLSETEQHLKGV